MTSQRDIWWLLFVYNDPSETNFQDRADFKHSAPSTNHVPYYIPIFYLQNGNYLGRVSILKFRWEYGKVFAGNTCSEVQWKG